MRTESLHQALCECTGVVLAGGRSSRMGRDKAALELDGQLLLSRVVHRLGEALHEVIVIGPEARRSLVPHVSVIPDQYPGAGPLGGLVTALRTAATPRVFLVGCDMPFVAPPLVHAMALLAAESPEADVVLPRSADGLEYLHAIYSRSCLPIAEPMLPDGCRALHELVRRLRVCEVPPEVIAEHDPAGLSTFNVNTPEEWLRARALAGEHHEPLQ